MKTAKRFYKDVSTAPLDEGFAVLLDGRVLKTPRKQKLVLRQEVHAQLVADEWDAQIDDIRPETMPVTRLVNVSIELTPVNRDQLIGEFRRYAETDLLCYRAAAPLDLAEMQAEKWDPVLRLAAERGVKLKTTDAVLAISQDPKSLDAAADYAAQKDHLNLTLLMHLTAVYGSAVLAMAVTEKLLSVRDAYALSRLDNLYQIEQWGEDEEAAKIAADLETEIISLCRLLE